MPQEQSIGRIFNNKYDARSHDKGTYLVDSNTLIGFEIELENVSYPDNFPILNGSPFWAADNDSSLRGSAVEWKFSMPLRGADVEAALKELENDIILNADPVKSDRTSSHVHIDVNRLSKYELYRFVLLAITVERLLYHYVSHQRDCSIFCVPFYKSDVAIEDLHYLLDSDLTMKLNIKTLLSEQLRYSGINLNPIKKYGTVEFRMLGAEWRAEKLLDWLNILLLIKKYAVELDKPMIELHKDISTIGADKIIDDIFGDYAHHFKYDGVQLDIIQGVRLAQQIEYSDINLNIALKLGPLTQETNLFVDPTITKPFLKAKQTKKSVKQKPSFFIDMD